jgi:glyoxylase-like metal-dependent hydrolase (beta-lactamase superfamily II)
MLWSTELGRFTIYGIEDGWMLRDPMALLPGSDPAVWAAHPEFLEDGKIRVSFGCFLVTGPSGATMVDTGLGPTPEAADRVSGEMPRMLEWVGVRPEEVDVLIHTHLHMDHIGGDTVAGAPFFPNATVYVHTAELDHWLTLDGSGGDRIRTIFEPLRVEPIDGDFEVRPGITMVESIGHTPGHVSVELIAHGGRAIVAGDVTHHPLQASHPEWNVSADLDPIAAESSRRSFYDKLASSGMAFAAGHFPRPGFGTVTVEEGIRVYVPGAVEGIAS